MKECRYNWKNYICVILVGFVLFCILSPKMIAFAGGINGNEARVIAAASGTFQYDGKTYRAGSAYINSLTSYLCNDDVDLTAAQADEAISMMYANVAEGVAQGYLYEVGGTTTETTTEEVENITENDKENLTEETTTEESTTESLTEEDKKTSDGEYDVWDMMSNETVAKEKLQERPEKEDAEVSVELEEDKIVIEAGDKEISISKDTEMIPEKLIICLNLIAVTCFVITCGCAFVLFWKKCMVFRIKKGRKARPGHSKRRKLRRHTRNVLTVIMVINIVGILLLAGGYVSLFNKDVIMRNMQNSGYFRYAYSQYVTEATEQVKPYEEYLFEIKQRSIQILDGSTSIVVPDSNVTPYIYNLKIRYMEVLRVGGVLGIITLLMQIILMVYMDQKRERGIKHIAVSDLIASVVLMIMVCIFMFGKPYQMLYIEPDYLYLFLVECITWGVKVMAGITAFGIAVGMILIGVYNTLKNHRNE